MMMSKGQRLPEDAGETRLSIRLDPTTRQWLELEAEATGTTISALIREALALLREERQLMFKMREQILSQGVTYPSLKKPTAEGWQKMSVGISGRR